MGFNMRELSCASVLEKVDLLCHFSPVPVLGELSLRYFGQQASLPEGFSFRYNEILASFSSPLIEAGIVPRKYIILW